MAVMRWSSATERCCPAAASGGATPSKAEEALAGRRGRPASSPQVPKIARQALIIPTLMA
jgi:hypothetical protein